MGGPREKEIPSLAVNLQNQVCYVCSKDHDGAGKGQTIPFQKRELRMEREWDRSLRFGGHSAARKGTPLPGIASTQKPAGLWFVYFYSYGLYIFMLEESVGQRVPSSFGSNVLLGIRLVYAKR